MSCPKLTKKSTKAIIEKLKFKMYRIVAYRPKIYIVQPGLSIKNIASVSQF